MTDRHWTAAHGSIPHDIDPDAHASVTALLEGAMRRRARKAAIVSGGQTFSYGQIDALSRAFCAYLQGLGVVKGRVPVTCRTR